MGTHSQEDSHRIHRPDMFFAEHGYLEVPSLVQWLATLRCGLSCAHCLAVSKESGFDDMPLSKVKGLIDEVAAMGVGEFLITGGEPLGRPDLAEVIAYLGHKQLNWTLNTATLPSEPLRTAIARNRPGFVAVSLDGPKAVHDAFRGKAGAYDEAIEAIRFFKSLDGTRVCAGTTVTIRNYRHLDETFHLAVASGADQWGIHLLVPEGRAAERPDLFLSKSQLKRLITFVARKRRYFRVEMADEIGYLGSLEPLVRDRPLTCGAGRAQCVVLPDGEVVPCTTLDRSCSAGNIHERPLAKIWAEGFANIRQWQPTGKCRQCDYAPACQGGCWLQRKAGKQCFKEVWHVPGVLKTAAGVAVCLGTLAALPTAGSAQAATATPTDIAHRVATTEAITGGRCGQTAANQDLDEAILNYYAELAAGLEMDSLTWTPNLDPNDPAGQFVLDFKAGALPEDITQRCLQGLDALTTEWPSLSLIALLWRGVSEPLFENDAETVYSEAERLTIRNTLAVIEAQAEAWRQEIFTGRFDPYLIRGRYTPTYTITKSGGRAGGREKYTLQKDLDEEHWGVTPDSDALRTSEGYQLEREAAEVYFQAHHYADHMDLVFTFPVTGQLILYTGGEEVVVSSHIDGNHTGHHTVGIFDVITTAEDVTLSFTIRGTLRIEPPYNTLEETLLNDAQDGEEALSETIEVTLEGGSEYTYVELLQTIYEQQRTTLLPMAGDWLVHDTVSIWNEDVDVVAAVYQNGTLLWPAFHEMIATGMEYQLVSRSLVETPLSDEDAGRAVLKDIDFWMF